MRILIPFLMLPALAGAQEAPLHGLEMPRIDGTMEKLSAYRGKALLIVNVASKCGLTPQYAGLQKLYEEHREEGFEILAFPANDFGRQEPGTNEEIAGFCSQNYGVSFPLFSKIAVTGEKKAPLYRYLTERSPFKGEIRWNFEKWVVDREGKVLARFHPRTKPDDLGLLRALHAAIHPPEAVELPPAESGAAAQALHAALARAKEQGKEVFLHFSADGCSWCKRWKAFQSRPEVAPILEESFVLLELTTDRMKDGEALRKLLSGGRSTGIPFMVWLTPDGRVAARSFDSKGQNIGSPYTAREIEDFMSILSMRAARASADQLAVLNKSLTSQGEQEKR